jgi:cobalt-zinc-cadmium efflux system outer membrane protein
LNTRVQTLNTQNNRILAATLFTCVVWAGSTFGQASQGSVKVTLDQAIEMALQHNHGLLATRTTVLQSQAQEITANLRPNPTLFTDWEYLPLYKPGVGILDYLHDSTEGDLGMSYLFERAKKRQHRLQAAKDATTVTRSQVVDSERTLTFQVAQLFINVQLAESTLQLAQQDLASFQNTVDISQSQFNAGGISENDYLKIKLQLLQFQQDVQQTQLAREQALSDLRQQLGYESVPPDYEVAGAFEYQPLTVLLEELQMRALENRPDLRAAVQGITAANSQYQLAKANGKQDVTFSGNYSHVNAISAFTFSVAIPLPIFDRNQGEIARTHYTITQAQEQRAATRGQVLTDVKDAYEGLQESDRVTQYFRSGYLDVSQKNRDISEYAYRRGAATLLDFLDAERSYRATQLAYRQAIAAYLTALEQLRQAVGTRSLP